MSSNYPNFENLSILEFSSTPVKKFPSYTKSQRLWKFLVAELDSFFDLVGFIINDYYVKFNWFVAHCCFVRFPKALLNGLRKFRRKIFGPYLDKSSQKQLDFLWSKNITDENIEFDEVRWFVQRDGFDWPMKGYDSILLEIKWRTTHEIDYDRQEAFLETMAGHYNTSVNELKNCVVLNGMYRPSEDLRNLEPIYWTDPFDKIKIRRCTKFYNNLKPAFDAVDQRFYLLPTPWNTINYGYLKADFSENKPEFDHLIFTLHGNPHGHFGEIRDIAKHMQKLMETLPENSKIEKYRPMIIPIKWMTTNELSGQEKLFEFMTSNLFALRQSLHFKFIDIMYYMSPAFQNNVANHVTELLNTAYKTFVHNHPHFLVSTNNISIISHSIGSVIAYDVITGYRSTHNNFDGPKLNFQVQNTFLLGSPLALFTAAREIDLKRSLKSEFSKFYNIIHPLDPVAFRLEPCFNEEYGTLTPEPIYPCYAKKAKKIYGNISTEYMYCSTEYAQKLNADFEHMNKRMSEGDKLLRRIDFFVLPKKEDIKQWGALKNDWYWTKTTVVNFIRDQIYENRNETQRLEYYSNTCCNLFNKNLSFYQRFKNWLYQLFYADVSTTLLLITGHFIVTVLPTCLTIYLMSNQHFPGFIMEKLVLYPYTSWLQPILLSSYKFPLFVYGVYSMNLPFIIMPVLFYSTNPTIETLARIYQMVISPIFMGCTAFVCYGWPYFQRKQNNKLHRNALIVANN